MKPDISTRRSLTANNRALTIEVVCICIAPYPVSPNYRKCAHWLHFGGSNRLSATQSVAHASQRLSFAQCSHLSFHITPNERQTLGRCLFPVHFFMRARSDEHKLIAAQLVHKHPLVLGGIWR